MASRAVIWRELSAQGAALLRSGGVFARGRRVALLRYAHRSATSFKKFLPQRLDFLFADFLQVFSIDLIHSTFYSDNSKNKTYLAYRTSNS